jgi:tetratricopeptide (TPR) repeat protein
MDVTETARIDELRRRVQKDPTTIAFAQLAEEYRRVGDYQEAVNVCRSGLARHPSYLSARVTLGRALMELEEFSDAQVELEAVLDLAPDNLAAIRALADIHQRHGDAGNTFHKYTTTLEPPRETPPPPAPRVEEHEAVPHEAVPHEAPDPLAALTLDLPPPPDFSSWSLDTAFSLPDSPSAEPAIAQQAAAQMDSPEPDPVIDTLQHWLAAIVSDRSNER